MSNTLTEAMNSAAVDEAADPVRAAGDASQVGLPSSMPDGAASAKPGAPEDEADDRAVAKLEELAAKSGLLPIRPPRRTCSIPAENLLRQLGQMASDAEPWLPLGTVGPLLVFCHHNPAARDFWQVPEAARMACLVTEATYRAIYEDLGGRLTYKPLGERHPKAGALPPVPKEGGIKAVLDWFVEFYPISDDERDKIRRLVQENASKPLEHIENLAFLPRHYGAAVLHWAEGLPCFNPEEAPGQTRFPDSLLEKHGVYPLHCGNRRIYLMSPRRSNFAFEDEWHSMGNESIEIIPVVADPGAVSAAINRNRSRSSRESKAQVDVGELLYSEAQGLVEIDPAEMGRINPTNPNNTPEQIVHWVLNRAVLLRASDLHVEKFYNTVRFRARIDGELHTIHSCSEEEMARYIALLKNYSNMTQARQTLQDARFAMKLGKRRIDVRVSAVPCRKEMQKITMRFLDKQDGVKTLDELNLSERQTTIVNETMHRDQGLVLVTGPTGSGKTTTLYAFLNSINEEGINIHTIEDPIEYEIEGINQTQTDAFNGIDFPNGLRALLRADPDVILIGESRDEETANAAINAALTGHLVLTTLHANDSLRAVSRLLSMGIAPYLLADALALSQAQRLVRRLCPYCKHPVPVTPQIQEYFQKHGVLKGTTDDPIYEKVGCEECHGTGYIGRVALMEMCPVPADLADLIASGAPMGEMRRLALHYGVLSLYQEGLIQVLAGNTTFEEIRGLAYTSSIKD